jgi:UDP-N-acetylglucosamine diphosphorylase / glucose-1-phosphate thymidylyltransferase / UDP-N-acetylgalactosamine diphosphorylase / glucosamine-1-phosphate N-acetyltransferase / galactosamine-1-phosphate N-acetyltransferase
VNLCLYEDPAVDSFGPHVLLRPVFALRCGIFSLAEKLVRAFPESPLVLLVRPELEELCRALYPTAHVGTPPEEETLFVNGRLCMTDDEVLHFLAISPAEASYMAGGVLFAAKVRPGRVAHAARHLRAGEPERAFEDLRFPAEVNAFLARSVADLIRWSPRQIVQDFRYAFQPGSVRGEIDPGAHVIRPEAVHVARGARVQAGAVLNAEEGPILIQENATVEPLAYIEGPAVVGTGSRIRVGAKVRGGSSIGPVCKIGGEIEASVVQGYSNKQHDGFLGHSFVGEWVNLGANTNDSDLKNNYGEVRFFRSARAYLDGAAEGSGQKLLGAAIGDFTKTGISTSITTGAVLGIGCNLYGTELWPAYVPSFVWGTPGSLMEHRIEAMIETAARAMERRRVELAVELDSRIRQAFDDTKAERALYLGAAAAAPAERRS